MGERPPAPAIAEPEQRRARELEGQLQELIYAVSHDLQEPVRKILSFSEFLLDDAEGLPERTRGDLGRVRSAAERLGAMIQALLQLSRVETRGSAFAAVDLSSVAQRVRDQLQPWLSERQAALEISGSAVVDGDAAQLEALVGELVKNGVVYNDSPRRTVQIAITADATGTQLRVGDNGIGFEAGHDLSRMLRLFQRLHPRNRYSGLGVGLTLCQRIASRHGAVLSAESAPGAGATVIVTFPRSN